MSLRIGLLVNPIAGIGGPAALKGSDLDWQKAIDDGFAPQAALRTQQFVDAVEGVEWLTVPGAMGVPGLPTIDGEPAVLGQTNSQSTKDAAIKLRDAGVDLICFAGGDGTASDVAIALGTSIPCLGIPAGVKITSPVFAHDLREASALVSALEPRFATVARDVTDLDEEAYRAGRVETTLRGSLLVPMSPFVQGGKCATSHETPLEPLVEQVMEDWHTDEPYLVGAGSVCKAIKDQFWGEPTLLGVDAIVGGRLVETDLDSHAVEAFVESHPGTRVMLSIIGGQGMLLGRGTQMLTPKALRTVTWDRIHVVAPPEKLVGLSAIHVDSGDVAFDQMAPKHIRIRSGWNEMRMMRIASINS